MKINTILTQTGLTQAELSRNREAALGYWAELRRDTEAFTGWVNQPQQLGEEFFTGIETLAEKFRAKCDTLIVIGIGGSYLGTAAVIDALGRDKGEGPEVIFAGNNMSGSYLEAFRETIRQNEVCLCVVSKSGGTMESRLAFSILKDWMYEKYGREETARRIAAVTDPNKGLLREESNKEGYRTFEIPSNIGGRYSAFTPGILFPLAVAGVDIRAMVRGAAELSADEEFWKSTGLDYALTRFALLESGKKIEIFEYYDPSLRLIGEWCKQLFGESEGKEGKGLFPASLTFSTDLHSMGQFLQEGNQIFFETVINVLNRSHDVKVPASAGEQLAGRSMNEINQLAVEGVIKAHRMADIPIVSIELEDNREYCIGQLFYYLMMTAAVTGKLMGVDPFNQPGVEAYKEEIRRLLG